MFSHREEDAFRNYHYMVKRIMLAQRVCKQTLDTFAKSKNLEKWYGFSEKSELSGGMEKRSYMIHLVTTRLTHHDYSVYL